MRIKNFILVTESRHTPRRKGYLRVDTIIGFQENADGGSTIVMNVGDQVVSNEFDETIDVIANMIAIREC